MAVVRLNLTLIEMAGGTKEVIVTGEKPVALTSILDRLGLPPDEVGIIVKNKRMEDIDCMIEQGDVIELFPVLSGG